MKLTSIAALTATAIFASTLVNAQGPALNVDPNLHPHLAAAQDFARKAYERIADARRANDWDANGHANKAMDLLILVNNEIAAAAQRK
jgi:hypothetical protein